MIARSWPGSCSIAINPRYSASLIAARALALPMLARSAMRATGRVHFPFARASSRMTASTAIASVFKSLATSGGTTTVAARNRRPHNTTPRTGAVLLVSSAIDVPCYWTAVANLHHIDKRRLSNAQFKKVEELNEQVSELSDLASQYVNTAQRTYDRTEQRRLEDLADLAQDEADRLYNQLLAIKP